MTRDAADVESLTRFVTESRQLLVLTGAGCSTESGIPDYRDTNGDWKRPQPVQYQDFVRSDAVRQRYWARSMIGWTHVARSVPNQAHLALARLESSGHVHHLITQNVDGLHQRAGSRKVVDLHGRLDTIVCLSCGEEQSRVGFQDELEQRNPEWADPDARIAPDGDVDLGEVDYSAFDVPACDRCGDVLKPDVVFFGEAVPRRRVALALELLEQADALLVVGSSLMVFSGYRFARQAAQDGKPVAIVNIGRTRADAEITLKVEGRCGEVMPQLTAHLGSG